MTYLVDLHIHSHHAYATSKHLTLENIYKWGKLKGIQVIATGDFTHPAWFAEIEAKLEKSENGLYQLKTKHAKLIDEQLPSSVQNNPFYFIPSTEISCIYSRHQKVRKVHNLVILPDLNKVKQLNTRLATLGNLAADGRPTFSLDSYELLQMVLDISDKTLFIPAHAWTPWFGVFGSKSGFDSLEEAFGDLTPEIYAIETGLSSDPAMNRQWSALNNIALVSNSDAHSLEKLGREATMIEGELSYQNIVEAIKTNDQRLAGTIEFFPQEGKYHYDGHRHCHVSQSPAESLSYDNVCPVCGKPLTLGVLNRVNSLSSRACREIPSFDKQVDYIIPLAELIAEVKGVKSIKTKTVEKLYHDMIEKLGDEFSLLRTIPIQQIVQAGFGEVAEAIDQMRQGKVAITPGYDGVFGEIYLQPKKQSEQQNLL